MSRLRRVWRLLLLCVVVALVGCAETTASVVDEPCDAEFSMLNPIRRCNPSLITPKREYEAFRDTLIAWIAEEQKAGRAGIVAVYFRDLENGPWFGINEQEEFAPASLLKIPVMMAYLRAAQDVPSLLEEKLGFEGEIPTTPNYDPKIDPEKTVVAGKKYSAEELLQKMLIHSDNVARQLLIQRLKDLPGHKDDLAKTYGDLGIETSHTPEDNYIGVKTYSSTFRHLYNASYLNREMSQMALGLLVQSTFDLGLRRGVPREVPLAHKFGIRETEMGEEQLHDCGIVYHPATPYLICIMTRSKDINQNSEIIGAISSMIYKEVDARAKELEPAAPQ